MFRLVSSAYTTAVNLFFHYVYDVNQPDNEGKTPLYHACMAIFYHCDHGDKIKDVRWLLNHGAVASINQAPPGEETPLGVACQKNNFNLAQLLLTHGAQVNFIGPYGYTPLYWACNENNSELAELLFHYGAEPSLAPARVHSLTLLDIATRHSNLHLVLLLIKNRVFINAKARLWLKEELGAERLIKLTHDYNWSQVSHWFQAIVDYQQRKVLNTAHGSIASPPSAGGAGGESDAHSDQDLQALLTDYRLTRASPTRLIYSPIVRKAASFLQDTADFETPVFADA